MDTKSFNNISYGLFVLTSARDGKHNGCIINTLQQLTSDPYRVSICVSKADYTHDMIMAERKFNVSVISQAATFDLFRRFGFQSGRDVDKFDGFSDYAESGNELRYITKGCNTWFSCWVEQTVDLGTHTLFIAFVTDAARISQDPSATYAYYHSSIKPKPQAAGTSAGGKTIWRCTICGYEYVGDELPDDFVCPICKHGKDAFEKIVR